MRWIRRLLGLEPKKVTITLTGHTHVFSVRDIRDLLGRINEEMRHAHAWKGYQPCAMCSGRGAREEPPPPPDE